ncbi:hypothetical protein cyc_06037 [Cyclospora cayetanensis]|uniref:Uncharacterized protein n=1 Tax=Cyclospora cayetanensis TaxID=88456 RepID=A0A1D3CUJ6_9EIME|nr:hypothetical protein cyc_06037 [Cyclospora cayetanensis]
MLLCETIIKHKVASISTFKLSQAFPCPSGRAPHRLLAPPMWRLPLPMPPPSLCSTNFHGEEIIFEAAEAGPPKLLLDHPEPIEDLIFSHNTGIAGAQKVLLAV